MENLPPEYAAAVAAVWRNGALVGFTVGAIAGACFMLAVVCILEKPLKFKPAPGFRPRNAVDPNQRPLTREQVAQIRAAKEVLARHGYEI